MPSFRPPTRNLEHADVSPTKQSVRNALIERLTPSRRRYVGSHEEPFFLKPVEHAQQSRRGFARLVAVRLSPNVIDDDEPRVPEFVFADVVEDPIFRTCHLWPIQEHAAGHVVIGNPTPVPCIDDPRVIVVGQSLRQVRLPASGLARYRKPRPAVSDVA